MTIQIRRVAALAAVVVVGVVILVLLTRGDPPPDGARLSAAELSAMLARPVPQLPPAPKPGVRPAPPSEAFLTALDDDVRLLAHLRRRLAGKPLGSGWRSFPEGLRDLYTTLRMEEIARTDGFILGLVAVQRGIGDVEPDEAAMAYDLLGVVETGNLMRRLDAIVERDGAAWRTSIQPLGEAAAPPAPDHRELDRIASEFTRQLPTIRTARQAWLRDHQQEVLGAP